MTDTPDAPPAEYWHGVIARLGVPDTDGRYLLEPPGHGAAILTAGALPLPLYCLLPDDPAIGMAPGPATLRVIGEIQAVAADGDRLWGAGRFFLTTKDGLAGSAELAAGNKTLAAVSIRPDESAQTAPADGQEASLTVHVRWALLAAMITDQSAFPDTHVTALAQPPEHLVPAAQSAPA